MMKRTVKAFILALMCIFVSLSTPSTVEAAVKLNYPTKDIMVGKIVQLKVSGTTKIATWSSSNKKIATVTSTGKVKGIADGSCYIYATVSNKKYKCKVTVHKQTVIKTVKELLTLNGKTGYYKLGCDIDLSKNKTTIDSFYCDLDGAGYSLKNVKTALIKDQYGTIHDLNINCKFTTSNYIGVLAYNNFGTIQNCTMNGKISIKLQNSSSITVGTFCVGNNGTIKNCINEASISLEATGQDPMGNPTLNPTQAGGICCYNQGSIIGCTNKGTIMAGQAGGICNTNEYRAIVKQCTNTGNIKHTDKVYKQDTGGIVASNDGNIEDCYNAGNIVNGEQYGGGIAERSGGTISRCISAGQSDYNLVCSLTSYVIDCYYPQDALEPVGFAGVDNPNVRAFGIPTESLTDESAYPALDFKKVWKMGANGPVLR